MMTRPPGRRRQQDPEEAVSEQEDAGVQPRRGKNVIIRPKEREAKTPILEYLKYFKRVMKVNGWEDEEAGDIFVALLGPADEVVSCFEGKWKTLSELEKLLMESVAPMRDVHLGQLMKLSLKDDETVDDLRNRTVHLVSLVYGKLDEGAQSQIARDHLLFALPLSVQQSVLAAKPKTLEDTVSLAASCIQLQVDIGFSAAAVGRNVKPFEFNRKQPQGRRELFSRNRNTQVCWNCGLVGHIRQFCRRPTERRDTNSINKEEVENDEYSATN